MAGIGEEAIAPGKVEQEEADNTAPRPVRPDLQESRGQYRRGCTQEHSSPRDNRNLSRPRSRRIHSKPQKIMIYLPASVIGFCRSLLIAVRRSRIGLKGDASSWRAKRLYPGMETGGMAIQADRASGASHQSSDHTNLRGALRDRAYFNESSDCGLAEFAPARIASTVSRSFMYALSAPRGSSLLESLVIAHSRTRSRSARLIS